MNNQNTSKLAKDISNYIKKAWSAITKIEHLSYNLSGENDYYDEEHDLTNIELESDIRQIYISLLAIQETLGLSECVKQLKNEFEEFNGKLTNLSMLPYVGELHSNVIGLLWRHYNVVSILLGVEEESLNQVKALEQLERILINTPKIIYDRNIEPSKEAEVRKAVYDVLIHVFPDTLREIPIPQVTKTYKPDLGVQRLKVAIEYKYANSAEEVNKSVGGIYEDMMGYSGSEDWKHFYAVIYMTDVYFTQEQILAEFQNTEANKNWKPILVHGKGERKLKPKEKA